MPSVTTVIGSTNDTHIPSPYLLTSTQCKCQWATNPESISTPLTQLTPMFQAFHPRGLTTPFLLRPTHINYISLYVLNRESFIGRHPKYELTTHSSRLMMDDHTHAPTPNMLMSLCICNSNVTAISHVTCMMHTI